MSTPTYVKTFKGSINGVDHTINAWANEVQVRILNTSLTYDEKGNPGWVFVMVVFEPLHPTAPWTAPESTRR
ncbi:MAG: hypothetical protein ACO1SX_06040 [Actinomycetota bacterium]